MKFAPTALIMSLSVLGITACGGGSENSSIPPPVVPLAKVDSGNAASLVGVAVEAALESAEIGGLTDFTASDAGRQTAVAKSGPVTSAARIAQGTLGNVSYIPIGPEMSDCAVSGTVTVSGDLADPTTFTAGDVINVDSDMCDDGTGQIVDGLLEMEISSFEGDILNSEFLFGIDLVVTSFMVTEGGETTTANGDVGTTIDTRTPPIAEGSVFGASFTVSGMGVTESISEFSTIYTEDGSTFPISWTNNSMGTVNSSEVSGPVNYDTPITFAGSGENFPHTGHLLVTGADRATLLLRTIDDVNVEIDADYDGDGIVDETLFLTWVELENQG